jgi:hypothetical protein
VELDILPVVVVAIHGKLDLTVAAEASAVAVMDRIQMLK